MKLPNGAYAIISMEKLTGYCLNPNHASGKHKARVFASVLGITAENAEDLRQLIAQAATEGEVIQQDATTFGHLYKVDWRIDDQDSVILRTLWEIRGNQPKPRLVSAFIR
ncbi:hypothetical protein GS597_08825 [Synechococcales cyanobacterium C]|uniref:DUF6883 domain-containing protein n=1 Tax=Petrachloros mirabilis ULC683 TaxID=2781853 RepID=A0A8K2A759_9CYAN|nr:DUF6883 domain-containing protein [Petrachloros mirabilis]NCJ06604.1 hypothetical protein [Petrachloros mirabilis ULC683]